VEVKVDVLSFFHPHHSGLEPLRSKLVEAS
jgi:hypothetical protein